MNFTPTYDNLQTREPFLATHYNTLIDDIQAKTIVSGDFTYPFAHAGSVGYAGASIYNVGNFGSPDSSTTYARRIAAGLGFYPGNTGASNSTSFQAIIDGLPSSGSVIELAPGTHDVTSTIELDGTSNGVGSYEIRGQGMGITTIQAAVGHSGPVIRFTDTPASETPTRIILRDLTINAAQLADICIDMSSASRCELINVEVKNADSSVSNGYGLYMNAIDNCRFVNVYANNNDDHGFFLTDANGNPTHNRWVDCEADTNGDDGFRAVSGGVGNKWVHCDSHGNTNYGFFIGLASANHCRHLLLDGCEAYSNNVGIRMGSTNAGLSTRDMKCFRLVACTAYENTTNGMELIGGLDYTSYPMKFWGLVGCECFNNGSNGLHVLNAVTDGNIIGGAYCANDQDNTGGMAGINLEQNNSVGSHTEGWISIIGPCTSDQSVGGNQDYGILFTEDGSGGHVDDCVVVGAVARLNATNDHDFTTPDANYIAQTATNTTPNKPAFS